MMTRTSKTAQVDRSAGFVVPDWVAQTPEYREGARAYVMGFKDTVECPYAHGDLALGG